MKTKKFYVLLALVFSVALFFTACEDEETLNSEVEEQIEEANDYELATNLFELTEVDETAAAYEEDSKSYQTEFDAPCLNVTVVPNDNGEFWPRVLVLDFGETNCLGNDGRYRRGMIHVSMTAPWRTVGAVRTITFDDYYVDDYKLEGTKTVTNNGLNDDGNLSFTRTIENGRVIAPDGQEMTLTSTRTRELIEGSATPSLWDDVFQFTGESSGTNRHGKTFSKVVTTPLVKEFRCPWPGSGIIAIDIEDRPTVTLDYGDGTCDNLAQVSYQEHTRTITLRHRFRNQNNDNNNNEQ